MAEAVLHDPRLLAETEQQGDAASWIVFALSVGVLSALDVTYLQTPVINGRMSFNTAAKMTLFWISTGFAFNLFILSHLGWNASLGFMQGFLLEYMLSFDNLFVFHLVFAYYCTPEALIYRALYFGIAGAIVLRVIFLLIGFTFMSSGLYIVKFGFGAILIYSGIRSAYDLDDEDTTDPTNNRFIAWVTQNLPVSDTYEPHGHFFITVAEVDCEPWRARANSDEPELSLVQPDASTEGRQESTESAFTGLPRLESFEGSSLLDPTRSTVNSRMQLPLNAQRRDFGAGASSSSGFAADRKESIDAFDVVRKPARLRRKASLLLLVVVAIWVVDLVFAVDSVAAKLSSVDDIFLNCSSSAFAMLSLRSLYFVMETLSQTFQTLKYGIAAVLILIGLKLVFAYVLDISNSVCFALMLGIVAASMASSYWLPQVRETCESLELGGSGTFLDEEEEERELFERRHLPVDASGFGGHHEGSRGLPISALRTPVSHEDPEMAGGATPSRPLPVQADGKLSPHRAGEGFHEDRERDFAEAEAQDSARPGFSSAAHDG